jgi:tetrapyrrole methylase family protein/MazG family protein
MSRLRGPRGCAWDRQQTHQTLIPYLFEEAREVKQAIARKDMPNLQEELGDILLQVLFHAQLAAEKNIFTIDDVLSTLAKKLIRRHPHVFGKTKVRSTADIIKNWRRIKQ